MTGTDTEVGKTRISAALLHWVASRGRVAVGFKPVAAGTTLIGGMRVNEDVRLLRDASSAGLTDAEVGPFQFDAACAPHVAAALEGRAIDRAAILAAGRALRARGDFLVVEGVGGFCVPLGPDWDSSDIACGLALPVILVVGLRLGCLNHALLTAEAIKARHLPLAGWIANTIDPAMAYLDHSVSTLRHEFDERRQLPCLGVVPWLDDPHPEAVAAHLDDAGLTLALGLPERVAPVVTLDPP
ncbi:MAG TPA: dethiobiotin synthase [Burkholderiaceae bacterium]|nr:dethiobiotin synthase [Burkholderiaceae bacterium]